MPDALQDAYRSAMRRLAATVTVVTTASAGRRYGITVTSIASVSIEPPSLLVCINRRSSVYAPLRERRAFCVNMLGEEHGSVCSDFSGRRPLDERFESGLWRTAANGLPYLVDAQATVLCRVVQEVRHGTHAIFIGEVERISVEERVSPLLYVDGGTARCASPEPAGTAEHGRDATARLDARKAG